MAWRLLDVEWPDKPYYNLAVEEAVALAVEAGVAPNTLRFWRNDNTIVIGRLQCASLEVRFQECLKHGVKVVRRFTGGGAVYHDLENLNYAVSFKRPSPIPGDDVSLGFKTIGEAVALGLKKLGVEACFAPVNDVQVGGRKISGMAGSLMRGVLFIHGCLLVGSNLEILSRVLNVPREKLEAKGVEAPRARVTTLKAEVGRNLSMEEVKGALLKGFEETFNVKFEPGGLTGWELKKAEQLYREKYSTMEWNLGPCTLCPERERDVKILVKIASKR
ncbi:MAG: lipoate--protein ligase family protein [Candidatus Hecatellaceae archaeon]